VTPDPALHDHQLETEIKLVGDLVLAASQSEQHLTDERIDEVLGLDTADGDGSARAADGAGAGDGAGMADGSGAGATTGDGSGSGSGDGAA
jgi:hypothetical protein